MRISNGNSHGVRKPEKTRVFESRRKQRFGGVILSRNKVDSKRSLDPFY